MTGTTVLCLSVIGYTYLNKMDLNTDHTSALIKQNIEALSDPPEDKKGYKIEPYDCNITGVGEIKLGNGKIIKASAGGIITIDGARDCEYNGTKMCTPIACTQIYESIF